MLENQQKNDSILISWQAPEFIRHEKSRSWFIVLGILSALLIIVTYLMKNYLFILIIVLAAFLIFVQAKKYPRKIKFEITNDGITIDQEKYSFSDFKSFWIFEEEEPQMQFLSLLTKKLTQPHLTIPLGDKKPEEIKTVLLKFIPEKKHEETLSDILAKKIKF